MNFDFHNNIKIKVLVICSDEGGLSALTTSLNTITRFKIDLVSSLTSVGDAICWLRENDWPELIISDLILSDGLCFEIFDQSNLHLPVILLANDDQYAVQAFRLNCLSYLQKPVEVSELEFALKKFQCLKNQFPFQSPHFRAEPPNLYKKRFIIRTGDKFRHVSVEDIAYFYAENDHTYLVARENAKFIIDYKLDQLSALMDPNTFFRLSRKFMTNIHAVRLVHKYSNSRMQILLDPEPKEQILISRARVPQFLSWMEM